MNSALDDSAGRCSSVGTTSNRRSGSNVLAVATSDASRSNPTTSAAASESTGVRRPKPLPMSYARWTGVCAAALCRYDADVALLEVVAQQRRRPGDVHDIARRPRLAVAHLSSVGPICTDGENCQRWRGL